MLMLGAHRRAMREMGREEILSARFRLLVIMMKACLEECPMGNFRKAAIIRNSQELEKDLDSLSRIGVRAERGDGLEARSETAQNMGERLKLLIVMAKSFAAGYPLGSFRRLAISNTLSVITRALGIDAKGGSDSRASVA